MASPSDIAGLENWFEATTLVLNPDDPASSWTNDGSGADAAQATGARQPLFKTGVTNGLPALLFDGSDDEMMVTIAADATRTRFVVAKQDTNTAGRRVVDIGGGLGGVAAGTNEWVYQANSGSGAVSLGGTPTDWTLITVVHNSTASADAYINAGSATNFDPHDSYSTGTVLNIGSGGTGFAHWNGYIAADLDYDSALSATDRLFVRDYLLAKWVYSTAPVYSSLVPVPFM